MTRVSQLARDSESCRPVPLAKADKSPLSRLVLGFLGVIAATGFLAGVGVAQIAPPKHSEEYVPQVGQAGKDVIWVPTPEALIDRMLSMAKVTPKDFVVDLGSGDGRTVIAAAKRGARALGIEYNPDMVALSRRNAEKAGVADRAKFERSDIFAADFSKATVVTMYLLPDLNLRLRPKLLDMKPGTRIVSHAFNMGDWEPDERAEVDARTAMLWIVPAKVQGEWTFKGPARSFDVDFQQKYQRLAGDIRAGQSDLKLTDGRLNGEAIAFSYVDGGKTHRFTGQVVGDEIKGGLDDPKEAKWVGTRKQLVRKD